jgi:hypothetical protein
MKNKENQKLSYPYWILGLGFLAVLGFLSMPSWTRQSEEDRVLNAKRHAEVLGYQVFEIYREAAHNSIPAELIGSRSPASMRAIGGDVSGMRESGSIGADPWGQPYRYKILSSASEQLKVQIWSAGPNKKFETGDVPGVAADSYTGDDVGIILSMSSKAAE